MLLNADGEGSPVIVAVADGHGSARCPRSHIGSLLAVEAAIYALPTILSSDEAPDCRIAAGKLIEYWRKAISEHLTEYPLDDVSSHSTVRRGAGVTTEDSVVAYGTTILVASAVNSGLLYLQIGDGDILVVPENGEVNRPLPLDHRLFANETTSLSSKTAKADCRGLWVPENAGAPCLVMLATDGYLNSFRQEDGFLKAASDLRALMAEEGRATVEKELEGWLKETSDQGSGDDITLALLYADTLSSPVNTM